MLDAILPCPITETGALATPEFATWTRDLAVEPSGNIPFMISYRLRIRGEDEFVEPDCAAWIEQRGRTEEVPVDHDRPELARKVAPQLFGFLADFDLRQHCAARLRQMASSRSGEVYYVCLSPHGLLMASESLHFVVPEHGPDAGFAGFMPTGLSNHARLAALAGLQHCATAILMGQYSAGTRDQFTAVRVRQA